MKVSLPSRSVLIILVLLALLLALPLSRFALGVKARTVAVTQGPLTETIVSTGRVITPSRIAMGAKIAGVAARVLVEEGEKVRAGQVLATLVDREPAAALEQARKAWEEASARMDQIRQVTRPVAEQLLAQSEATLSLAEKDYARTRELSANGFFSEARLDEARRNLDNARAQREAALRQLQANQPAGADSRVAEIRKAEAAAAIDVALARVADTTIRAPADGLLLRKRVEAGDVVAQGRVLFEMAADGETQILLQVDEKNLGFLRPGQAAAVAADAYPGRTFPGEVFFIAPGVDAEKGSVEIKLRVARPPAFLKPDMTVSAEIEVGRKEVAILLPSEAIRDAARQPWVLVLANGRARRQPVQLGLKGVGWIEVISGVKPGDQVIPPSESRIREGQRVRAGT